MGKLKDPDAMIASRERRKLEDTAQRLSVRQLKQLIEIETRIEVVTLNHFNEQGQEICFDDLFHAFEGHADLIETVIQSRQRAAQQQFRYDRLKKNHIGQSSINDGELFAKHVVESESRKAPMHRVRIFVWDFDENPHPETIQFVEWVKGFDIGIRNWPIGTTPPGLQLFGTKIPIADAERMRRHQATVYDRAHSGLNLSIEDYFAHLFESMPQTSHQPAPAVQVDESADPNAYKHPIPGIPYDIFSASRNQRKS
jgi:hypothetical protein